MAVVVGTKKTGREIRSTCSMRCGHVLTVIVFVPQPRNVPSDKTTFSALKIPVHTRSVERVNSLPYRLFHARGRSWLPLKFIAKRGTCARVSHSLWCSPRVLRWRHDGLDRVPVYDGLPLLRTTVHAVFGYRRVLRGIFRVLLMAVGRLVQSPTRATNDGF